MRITSAKSLLDFLGESDNPILTSIRSHMDPCIYQYGLDSCVRLLFEMLFLGTENAKREEIVERFLNVYQTEGCSDELIERAVRYAIASEYPGHVIVVADASQSYGLKDFRVDNKLPPNSEELMARKIEKRLEHHEIEYSDEDVILQPLRPKAPVLGDDGYIPEENVIRAISDFSAEAYLSLGETEKKTGLSRDEIKFYEDAGIIHPSRSGKMVKIRTRDLQKLSIAAELERMGYRSQDIANALQHYDTTISQSLRLQPLEDLKSELDVMYGMAQQAAEEIRNEVASIPEDLDAREYLRMLSELQEKGGNLAEYLSFIEETREIYEELVLRIEDLMQGAKRLGLRPYCE
jgi:DNA-binding transcriptional MerR regulator/nucleotide-binding universal stress UspA family protein